MQLIDRIEINYFRSVYSISLKKIKDINVLIGPNDAGKSNILRALNLFFNYESGYGEEFQFLQDVTHLRQEEAREAKGRLTIWIKVHFNNVERWKTLPRKFFIKKSWNRYSEYPEISSDVKNKQSLTRFQNKLRFHYIPAVKERDIFSDYLNLLYETLSDREDIEFRGPADALSAAVNASITDLIDKLRVTLSVESNVQIPNDLESIFERLEFYTDQDAFRVPLSRRGDGLQVRHIPHILQYISKNNKCINIWAYEEPENSLEMSNAFSLANEFESDFSEKNQIFITSHSPAFYSLESDRVKHYLVKKFVIQNSGQGRWVTAVEDLENVKVADTELGVAQLIAHRSQDAYSQIQRLTEVNNELAKIVKPVLLTEGKTDPVLLNAAWGKLHPNVDQPFEIKSCDMGGADGGQENAGADELRKILEATTKDQAPIRVGLFDRDEKGLACFGNLKKHNVFRGMADVKINRNRRSGAVVLPSIRWGSPYDDLMGGMGSIEMMIPYASFPEDSFDISFSIAGKRIPNNRAERLIETLRESPDLVEDVPFKVVPKFRNKANLAEVLAELEVQHFIKFRPLFEFVRQLLYEMN